MPDYIPAPDDEFDTYARDQFVPYAQSHREALGLTVAEVTALSNASAAWGYSWAAYQNALAAYRGAVEDKDEKRETLTAELRSIAGKVQANPEVTNVQREGIGVPVYKTGRTPVPVPSTTPSMQRIDTSTRAILRLFFYDATTPDSRAKPPGVHGCEIRAQIGGAPPTNPEAMPFLALDTRSPYRADFEAPEIGQTAYFAMRWVNTRGEPGPWSQFYSAVVPS